MSIRCPICNEELFAETVDIGVGEQQIAPYICDYCQWMGDDGGAPSCPQFISREKCKECEYYEKCIRPAPGDPLVWDFDF